MNRRNLFAKLAGLCGALVAVVKATPAPRPHREGNWFDVQGLPRPPMVSKAARVDT